MIEVVINGQKRMLTEEEYQQIQNDNNKKLTEYKGETRVLEKMHG